MKSIFRFFSERNLLASLLTIMVLLFGINGVMKIQRNLFPKVKLNQLYISTIYPGASPEDVELSVTNKIETQLKPIEGVKKYRSISMEAFSYVIVDLSSDLSDKRVEETIQNVKNAVGRIKDLPKEIIDLPIVERFRTSEIPIIEVGLTSDKMDYRTLREHARILEKKIKDVDGISRTRRTGYRAREIKVELSPKKLKEYQIPMQEIIYAIQARNIRGTGGTLESFVGEKDILTLAQFEKPYEVGDVIVRTTFDGPAVRVKDLAVVKDDFEEEKTIGRINGKEVISFTVYKNESADIIRTVKRLREFLDEEKQHFPDGLELVYSNDMSRYVVAGFDVVKKNGIAGIILVIVVLTIFLNFRTGFWVAIGIPTSILGTIALLPFFGVSLDVITLSAMILVLGIIVDDAIIISENINRRREMGDSPIDAAVNGLSEVFSPVLTSVLTTLLAFAPMFFIPGEEGKFIFVIPLVITLTLTISLLESVFALPAHVIHNLKPLKKKKHEWFDSVKSVYKKMMIHILKFRYVLVVLFGIALSVSIWYATSKMRLEVFPNTGASEFSIYAELPIDYTLERTSERIKEIEETINQLPIDELESFVTRIGVNGDGFFNKNEAVISVVLKPFSTRDRNAEQIADDLRDRFKKLEGFNSIIVDIEESGPYAKKPIIMHLIGSNDSLRNVVAGEIVTFMDSLGTLQDIKRNDKEGKTQVEINLDYEKLARLDLTVADIAQNVRIAFDGEVVTKVRYGEEDVKFRVIMNKNARKKINYLNSLSIPNASRRLIPLNQVARLTDAPGAIDYRHYNGERVTTITSELQTEKTTAEEATAQILERFNISRDYPGLYLLSEGAAEKKETTMNNNIRTFIIAIVGIYFLLMILFNSITQPFMVLIAIPFGIVGIVPVFALHDLPFCFMSMLGIIGLCGVVVNDSLVLVDHLNKLIKENPDKSFKELIIEGSSNRLRAILLTTITTAAGLLPLAYGIGGSDPYNAPMALALGWGLIVATPLTLTFIPSMYMIGNDIKRLLRMKSAK